MITSVIWVVLELLPAIGSAQPCVRSATMLKPMIWYMWPLNCYRWIATPLCKFEANLKPKWWSPPWGPHPWGPHPWGSHPCGSHPLGGMCLCACVSLSCRPPVLHNEVRLVFSEMPPKWRWGGWHVLQMLWADVCDEKNSHYVFIPLFVSGPPTSPWTGSLSYSEIVCSTHLALGHVTSGRLSPS